MAKWVYMFTEGNANMRNLLGCLLYTSRRTT